MTMLLEGAILAIIVVWFFLRDIRATLISAAALPLAVLPTFWALHIFGFTMNTLTMLALTLVVGMLVDDAIVEVENIVRHLRMGKPPLQAATDAAIEIGLAVVATSLTLCAVFVPVSFMSGIPGQLFKPFGFTATIAVLFSLLVARTLTPMMASKFMRACDAGEEQGRFKTWYLGKVQWVLAAPLEDAGGFHAGDARDLCARPLPCPRGFSTAVGLRLRQPQRRTAARFDDWRTPSAPPKRCASGSENTAKSRRCSRCRQSAQCQHVHHAA